MQEDKDSMQKELQAWRAEATLWHSRLTNEHGAGATTGDLQCECAAIQDEIDKKQAKVAFLRRQVLINEASLNDMIQVVIDA
jgi:Microtubule-binding protein MIP-T3 C-terminal region